MRSGGWETAKDYRDLIKNKEEAVSLEQQNRVVKSEELIEKQLGELSARLETEPENLDVVPKNRRVDGDLGRPGRGGFLV